MSLNIGGDKDDIFYRYKMPPIMSKIEGKGNGIKTVLPNIAEIAKALNRPPMYPSKYFGTELGTQTKHEDKNDRYIINGAHDAAKLQDLLAGFILKFVLCPNCKNPETLLKMNEKEDIYRQCVACGSASPIDMRHKLSNYMKNNPTTSMAPSGRVALKNKKPSAKPVQEEIIAEPEWTEPKKPKKAKKKQQSSSEPDEDPLDDLAQFVLANPEASDNEILAEINNLNIDPHFAGHVLAQVLIRPASISDDIERRIHLFCNLVDKDDDVMPMLVGGFEKFVVDNDCPEAFPAILSMLYQGEAVDEETILLWAENPSRRFTNSKRKSQAVQDAAAPFIEWLKTEEE